MVLNKILKPILTPFTKEKWQSKNLDVRKKAVQDLPVSDQETLNFIAMNDSDESIRALAANKLSDLDLLQTIIMKGTNEMVKQAAQTRLFQLLCGLKHPIPDYEVREKMIRGSRNPALLEFVAANADQAELREITIKRISRDPLLGDVALTDNSAKVRQLAAQQIAKRSTLERVAKNSRRKDKRVYKIVKSKLDRIIEDEQRPALLAKEVLDICEHLEKLYKRNRLLQEKTTFENYVARWSEIQNFANEETSNRYHTICGKIINGIDQLESDKEKERETILTLEHLLTDVSTAVDELLTARETDEPAHKIIEDKEKIILNLGQEWDKTIKFLTDQIKVTSLNAKFQAILDLADNNTETPASSNNLEKTRSLVEQAESMQKQTGYLLEKTISALQNKFNQQIDNNQSEENKAFENRFKSALNTLKQRLTEQQENAAKFTAQIDSKIISIRTMIDEGHISKADKSLHELLKQIDKSQLLSSIDKQNFHEQLKTFQADLGDLSSWRNWAHDNERENLTLKAEKLAQQAQNSAKLESEFSDITLQVKELRKQWKKMRSHTQEELWQRFNNACNLAYEQCIPYIDKQSEIRKNNLKAKQELCEQLENYIATMAWPSEEDAEVDLSIDWIHVDKITKQARKEWSNIGFVERKVHKNINQRFDNALEIIRHELKKAWQINQQQFYQLIQQVQDLSKTLDDDLSNAINIAKACQRQWKTIGPVSTYQRNKLWKKFRKACDVIFDKRQENIEHKNSQNNERLREKQAICENLEALNQQPLDRVNLESAFNDIDKLWQELIPQAKAISKEVNQRYSTAKESYQHKLHDLILQEQAQQLVLLKQKAELCNQVELTNNASEENKKQFQEQWQTISALPQAIEARIKHRFDNALQVMANNNESLKATELKQKQDYCLKYEILLGKESPAEVQKQRMEMQVELLNSNLGNKKTEAANDNQITSIELQLQWFEMSNYTQDSDLEERFNRLIADA